MKIILLKYLTLEIKHVSSQDNREYGFEDEIVKFSHTYTR